MSGTSAVSTRFLKTRVARRMAWLFFACAVVPVIAAGLMAVKATEALEARTLDDRLASLAKNYGMMLVDKLAAADTMLVAAEALPSGTVSRTVGGAPANAATRALVAAVFAAPASTTASAGPLGPLPAPSARQLEALAAGRPVVEFGTAQGADGARPYLTRGLADGRRVHAALATEAFWGDPVDLPDGLAVAVLGAGGRALWSSRPLDAAALSRVTVAVDGRGADGRTSIAFEDASGDARPARAWRVFLDGAFASPPLTVVAWADAPAALDPLGDFQFAALAGLAALVAGLVWLSIVQIRRQLAPLDDLLAGTARLADLDFTTPVAVHGGDEFQDLARAFNGMARNLERQFAALESMAEIDRLLLRAPDLETVLDLVLRRICALLDAPHATIVLLGGDATQLARCYDHVRGEEASRAVRRIAVDFAALQALAATSPSIAVDGDADFGALCRPAGEPVAGDFDGYPVWHERRLAGLLCIAPTADPARADPERIRRTRELADRIAVVLADLAHREQLHRQAHVDPLTELPNRTAFQARLEELLLRCRGGGRGSALLYVDLDHFKRVNDTAGHGAGDTLLRIVAERLAGAVKQRDVVARLGGDEFAVLLAEVADRDAARAVADRLIARLSEPVTVDGRDHYVSASIGIALVPSDGETLEDLLKHGDVAMYRAKEAGRGRAVFFERDMNARLLARAALETGLHRALRHGQFELHYQAIVRGADRVAVGAEALLRWARPPGETPVGPAEFVPIAEDSGLIVEIGAWALEQALRDFAAWRRRGLPIEHVSVNVSPRQLAEAGFPDRVAELLARAGLPTHVLQLEITEGVLSEGATTEAAIHELAARGVKIAIDDFGTGYSSLGYLRRFPISTVKIDRSFIVDVPDNEAAARLAETILLVGRGLDKRIVAEGVETEAQCRFLQARGCDAMQGWLFARPCRAAAFEARLLDAAGAVERAS